MNTNRSNAVFTGVLFIVATVAGVVGLGLLSPILDDAGYLSRVSADETQFLVGVCFLLAMAGACAGIAVAMYPVLRKHSEGLALGAVAFRVIEGALHAVAAISLALLLPLGQEFLKAGAPGSSHFQTLGVLLKAGNEWASNVGMLAFCLGALMYYIVFYQTRLVPRWLSGWGIVAIALSIVASILTMLRVDNPTSTLDTALHLPIFLQGMVLAVWLIAKGFDQTGIASASAKEGSRLRAVLSIEPAM